jgi:membrane fusion protein, multidrug efflux system
MLSPLVLLFLNAHPFRTFSEAREARAASARSLAIKLAVTIFTGLAVAACSTEAEAPAQPSPPEVGVVEIQPQRQTISTELAGRTRPRMVAEIRPQVGGIVRQRLFEEGAMVEAGQVLYQIEPASYQADVASAEAVLAKAEAAVVAQRATAQRTQRLLRLNAMSAQENDDAQAAYKQALAEVGVARANVATARINLSFTRITAPIGGRVDTSAVTIGALVTANQETALTTVQQLDPLYVDVTQSSTDVLRLKRDLAEGRLKHVGVDEAQIRLKLEDGSDYGHEGRLQFSGVTVNPGTGAVTLRALVPNPQGLLLPGMYVQAVLEEAVVEQAMMVPQQAVTRNPAGEASALVVNAENKVERRQLVVDRAIGNRWLVLEGIAPGDRVVVEGTMRISEGKPVRVVDLTDRVTSPPSAALPASLREPVVR